MNLWLINAGGGLAIGLIIWWFWLSTPRTHSSRGEQPIEIIVDDGVYAPARIEVPGGRPVTLRFIRRDASPCAEKVIFDDFDVSADLDLERPTDVTLTPKQAGEYVFTCQMRMYRGTLVVK